MTRNEALELAFAFLRRLVEAEYEGCALSVSLIAQTWGREVDVTKDEIAALALLERS